MAQLAIFVSFEFDKDNDLKNNFYEQSKQLTQHRIRDCSLREAYPTREWKAKARAAISGCDVVIVLVGQDTHSAPGVQTEVSMARSFGKPIFQVVPQRRTYTGVRGVGGPIRWKWTTINRLLEEV